MVRDFRACEFVSLRLCADTTAMISTHFGYLPFCCTFVVPMVMYSCVGRTKYSRGFRRTGGIPRLFRHGIFFGEDVLEGKEQDGGYAVGSLHQNLVRAPFPVRGATQACSSGCLRVICA